MHAATPGQGQDPKDSKYLRPIRKGEYDIANISLVGYDPIDRRPYEECHDEWRRALEWVQAQSSAARWWQIGRKLRLRWQAFALSTHLGMS